MTVTRLNNTVSLTASGLAWTGGGKVERVICTSDEDALTVELYDALTETAAKKIGHFQLDVVGSESNLSESFESGAQFETGCYVKITAGGTFKVQLVIG